MPCCREHEGLGCIPKLMQQGEVFHDMGNQYRQWGPQAAFRLVVAINKRKDGN